MKESNKSLVTVDWYLEKFERKMKGCSFQEAKSWVEGINTISDIDKFMLFKKIIASGLCKSNKNKSIISVIRG
jgi:hypothetical protein